VKARRLRLATFCSVLAASLLAIAAPAGADTLFTDGFESGNFSSWSLVQTGGDGAAIVQSGIVRTGAVAAQLSESATSGSKAYARKTFSSAQQDLTATGDFQVRAEGASGGNVPFFRFLDPTSTRLVSVYRQNGTRGSIGLAYGGAYHSTTGTLALNTWATIALHVITAGTTSTVEVRLNGALVYSTTGASLGNAGISTVQIGNDTSAQAFNLVADTIDVRNAAASTPSPPVNTVRPSISGTPQSGQTLTANRGTWTGAQPISYAYAWKRCDTNGANCATITGATGSTYVATSADVGRTLRVSVTATNSVGSDTVTSNPTTVVQGTATPPANTSPPTISGTAREGQTLSAGPGTWSGTQPISFTYRWQRCNTSGGACGAISGATAASYTATGADVGSTLRVAVTATNSAGSASAASAPTAVVQANAVLPGLVALWHMNETSGTVMYDSARTHNGTLRYVALGQPGFQGTAYGFNGTSSYVNVPTADDLNPGSANLTATIRLKTTTKPATPDWDLIRKGQYTTPGGEWKVEYQPSGQASCGFKGSSAYSELMAGPALNDGQWHTVQCVKTASSIKVVVDGQTFTKTVTIGSIANTSAVPIGARPGSEFFNGSLDEASIQVG
jgi:hypothetical protein